MVCLPCFIIPAFLWFYYRFLRPYMGPVVAKLEEWLAPLKAKWCPQCSVTGQCPLKPSKKSGEGAIKTRNSSGKISPSAPIDEESLEDLNDIDSEEKLEKVIQTGGFGTNVSGLRQRAGPVTDLSEEATVVRAAS